MIWSLLVVVCSLGVLGDVETGCGADYTRVSQSRKFYYTVANLVSTDLSLVEPPLDLNSELQFEGLLNAYSCLGYFGPIGPYGPLGTLGPIGTNTWNPSYWISGLGYDWSRYSTEVTGLGGPLSAAGPLGASGPLGSAYYDQCPCMGAYAHHLMNGGIFHVLGPTGPLGALGPLGPLGPIGAHGFPRDTKGNYVSSGVTKRTVSVPYDGTVNRQFELFENYDQQHAYSLTNNDCSFMVQGTWSYLDTPKSYAFTSNYDQFVTILVVPTLQMYAFDFTVKVTKPGGTAVSISSSSFSYMDHVVVKVPQMTTFEVKVTSGSIFQLYGEYRIFVVGSTSYVNQYDILGPYQHLL
eukprot:TRINITY_DN8100_c0_g1_i1.p1 TRINITY_DN8100_c0_g1~~TRINITY_DN8100_c0_g1_i1.p1  ORF type:complete len:351 (+),score=35.11 TRINITY_DN8100_c0_g1_i1:41-1093(+)